MIIQAHYQDAEKRPSLFSQGQVLLCQSSTCICLPAEASAKAGAFLSILEEAIFSAAC
jgi:hypothetical protein